MIRMLHRFVFNLTALAALGLLLNQQHGERVAPAPALPSLTVELRNARALPGKTPAIRVDFVMKNNTNQTITLVERQNSWGACQWEYEITDATGKKFEVVNHAMAWFSKVLTFSFIYPGEEYQFPSFLDYAKTKLPIGKRDSYFACKPEIVITYSMQPMGGDVQAVSPRSTIHVVPLRSENAWKYPVTLVGKFTTDTRKGHTYGEHDPRRCNWVGTVRTAPITVEAPTAP